jgi:hypothetical protein
MQRTGGLFHLPGSDPAHRRPCAPIGCHMFTLSCKVGPGLRLPERSHVTNPVVQAAGDTFQHILHNTP